ncbi:PIN-like domain-containing protein [Bradyrhizobium sp. cf659]|uniref:PIN-like domain-containing protein n=1 Tax=Bradyrhizobium sp. cf659 TaxID=1761771 RepID=UPI0008ECBB57|nr:PIN domain-containing protein [Bradyrhizobium sp. cf659]SFH69897.1 hypothetical protein SAMN04487925_10159 [Bradyrhizobium sp. cf659]
MGENEVAPGAAQPKAPQVEKAKVNAGVTDRNRSEAKPPAGPDLFLLEKIYPEAHRVFQPTEELAPKSNAVLVALDTNALLLPYSLGTGDLSALATVYSQFAQEGRLFLPERVAREFIKNRDRKLAEMAQAIDDRISRMADWDAKVTPLLLDGFSKRDALVTSAESLDVATKQYLKLLRQLSAHLRSWRGNDPVTTFYAQLFTKERMIGPGQTPEKIIEELDYGLRNKVPPGYKDSSKDDRGIGDVLIWMSLLHLGETTGKDLIFVTGEQKADWFVRSGNRAVYPRPELVEAYRHASGGRSLRLSSLHDLLKEMSAPNTLVTDVQVAEATANSAIQAAGLDAFVRSAHTTVSDSQGKFEYPQAGYQRNDFVGDNEATSPEEAELILRLQILEEELRQVRGAIAQLTQDELNASLTLPWNRAAQPLRSKESSLRRAISDLQLQLSNLPRLERRGAY